MMDVNVSNNDRGHVAALQIHSFLLTRMDRLNLAWTRWPVPHAAEDRPDVRVDRVPGTFVRRAMLQENDLRVDLV